MFDKIDGSQWFNMSQVVRTAGRPVLLVALTFLLASSFSMSVSLHPVQAQTSKKAKKAKKAKRAKARKKAKRTRRARRLKPLGKLKKVRPLRSLSNSVRSQNAIKAQLNQNTVTVMSGCCTSGAYTAFGADIKDMIKNAGDNNGLRVLPMLGGGAGTNVRDILYLRGIDMAILNTDVIDFYKGKPLYENLDKRIHYITKLFNEEVHLYAGEKVSSLHDLHGKRVGFNNSSAEVTGTILFQKLGIKPRRTVRISEGDGALALKDGRLDAMMYVTGKPIRNVARLKAIFPGIRLLPVNYDPVFIGSHLPTRLTHEDYPGLIKKGQIVPTIATRTILAVFNWQPKSDRYRRLEKFTNTFFDNFTKLRRSKNLHPKWAEVNLQAIVPGLTRFAPAQKWIGARTSEVKAAPGANPANTVTGKNARADLMKNFKLFLASRDKTASGTDRGDDTEKLIADFLRWQKQQR